MRPSVAAGRRFAEFRIGQTFGATLTVSTEHLDRGAELIGDFNPLHVDEEFARRSHFGGRILHGVLGAALCITHGAFERHARSLKTDA